MGLPVPEHYTMFTLTNSISLGFIQSTLICPALLRVYTDSLSREESPVQIGIDVIQIRIQHRLVFFPLSCALG
jgi:hypothetical protein